MARTRGVLVTLTLVAMLALVATLEIKRQAVSAQLSDLASQINEGNLGDQSQNAELAQKIIEEVRQLIAIPEGIEPTVATIIDVDALRERNPFYNNAENGDHLLVTPDRAILYSPKLHKIIDVVPVQLEPAEAPGSVEE